MTWRSPEDAELGRLVDGYLDLRTRILLAENRLQPTQASELDAAAAAQALRDFWHANPGCAWDDTEESELFWDVERLIAELDLRAGEAVELMKHGRE